MGVIVPSISGHQLLNSDAEISYKDTLSDVAQFSNSVVDEGVAHDSSDSSDDEFDDLFPKIDVMASYVLFPAPGLMMNHN